MTTDQPTPALTRRLFTDPLARAVAEIVYQLMDRVVACSADLDYLEESVAEDIAHEGIAAILTIIYVLRKDAGPKITHTTASTSMPDRMRAMPFLSGPPVDTVREGHPLPVNLTDAGWAALEAAVRTRGATLYAYDEMAATDQEYYIEFGDTKGRIPLHQDQADRLHRDVFGRGLNVAAGPGSAWIHRQRHTIDQNGPGEPV